jgi:hypothetical protein
LVRDEMVHVVTALPPADRQAAAEVGNEETNQCIDPKDVCDGSVASIMGSEHDLLLSSLG